MSQAMTDLAEIKQRHERDMENGDSYIDFSRGNECFQDRASLLALLSTGQNGEMGEYKAEAETWHANFNDMCKVREALSRDLDDANRKLTGVRALIKNCLCVTNVIGPLYGIGWNAAIDLILSRIDAAPSLSTGQPEVGREDVREVLYETECDPPVYGLTRDQAAKLADALLSAYHMQRRV